MAIGDRRLDASWLLELNMFNSSNQLASKWRLSPRVFTTGDRRGDNANEHQSQRDGLLRY